MSRSRCVSGTLISGLVAAGTVTKEQRQKRGQGRRRAEPRRRSPRLTCGFCGTDHFAAYLLIAGPTLHICDACARRAAAALRDRDAPAGTLNGSTCSFCGLAGEIALADRAARICRACVALTIEILEDLDQPRERKPAREAAHLGALSPEAPEKAITRFLNVDLVVESERDLSKLVEALGPSTFLLHHGDGDRCRRASFELDFGPGDAEVGIRAFLDLLGALPEAAASEFRAARRRTFDVGIQGGEFPRSFDLALSPQTIRGMSEIAARVVVTVYGSVAEVSAG